MNAMTLWAACGLLLVGLASTPLVSAHQDGCLFAQHVGGVSVHQLCFSSPKTCFSNAQATGSVEVHAVCDDPTNHPCLLKAQVEGVQVSCSADSTLPSKVNHGTP